MARENKFNQNTDKKYEERILTIRRVSKKTTGGNYISFSALVVIGDGNGNVGVGIGRGLEVPPAIQKAITQEKKNLVELPIYNETIPHQVQLKYKASRLLLKPAPPGTGLKVGGVVRVILDLAGVNNASGKIIGTRNQITNAYAVIEAIKRLKPRITAEPKAEKEEKKTTSVKATEKQEKKSESVSTEAKAKVDNEEKKTNKSKGVTEKKSSSAKATADKETKKAASKKKVVKKAEK